MAKHFYFAVYGTLNEHGHIEFHIDEDVLRDYIGARVWNEEEDEWEDYGDVERGEATLDLLFKTLEKKLRNPQ